MKSEELRALQGPLKNRYRENPASAIVIHRAKGILGDGITCRIEGNQASRVAGQHPAAGGSGEHACSAEMLLEALVGCAGVTMNAVATSFGLGLRRAEIEAEGEVDYRGTLAVSKETPVGFLKIRLLCRLDTDATDDQIATLLKSTERFCIVAQSLAVRPAFEAVRLAPPGSGASN